MTQEQRNNLEYIIATYTVYKSHYFYIPTRLLYASMLAKAILTDYSDYLTKIQSQGKGVEYHYIAHKATKYFTETIINVGAFEAYLLDEVEGTSIVHGYYISDVDDSVLEELAFSWAEDNKVELLEESKDV